MLSTPVGLCVALARKSIASLAALTLGASYTSTDPGGPAAQLTLRFNTDGTWDFAVGSGDTPSGTPTSATWLPAGASAADYEVKYTVTAGPSNGAVVTNGAAAYSALSAQRTIDITLTDVAPISDAITVTVDLRRITNTSDAVSDSVVLNVVES